MPEKAVSLDITLYLRKVNLWNMTIQGGNQLEITVPVKKSGIPET